jgi:hypothetical protein
MIREESRPPDSCHSEARLPFAGLRNLLFPYAVFMRQQIPRPLQRAGDDMWGGFPTTSAAVQKQ